MILDIVSCPSAEDQRDETTWGYHLLKSSEKGLNPEYSIADFGTGLRAGQSAAWSEVPCFGDIFHAISVFEKLSSFVTNKALKLMSDCEKIQLNMVKASIQKTRSVSFKTVSVLPQIR